MLHHVAIVTSEYPPEPTVSGRMMRDMAVYLNERGCRVSIICPYPSRGVSSPENPGYVTNEKSDEALIIRVPSFFSPRSSFPLRIRESWSFGRWSVCALRNLSPPPDVVYSATWPMLGQAWITAAVAALKVPHLTHVMDLYPESALLKTSPLVRKLSGGLLLRLDRWNAIRADHLAVISESMRQAYLNRRGLRPEQVSVVHTWQDETPFHRLPDPAQAFAKYGVPPGAFTFQYLGNIGPVAGVEHLVTSFRDAELKRCQLVIAGQGSNREVCRRWKYLLHL